MKRIICLLLAPVFLTFIFGTQASYAFQPKIAKGTEILVRANDRLTSETINEKDYVYCSLVSDFKINNKVIFKESSEVLLAPAQIKKRGFAGRGGYIELRRGFIKDADGNEYKLILRQKIQGNDRDWVVVCIGFFTITIILIPLDLIALVKGKSAVIEEGAIIECNFAEDYEL